VLAMHLCGDALHPPRRNLANFDYYEPLTVRDSSLSACTQAVMAAEVGHLDLAFDYLGEAALMDLRDLENNNARRRAHWPRWPAPGWPWSSGFGGLRHQDGMVSFAPRLPEGLSRLAFSLFIPGPAATCRGDPRRSPLCAGRRGAADGHAPRACTCNLKPR